MNELKRKKLLQGLRSPAGEQDDYEAANQEALNANFRSEEKGGRELDTPEMRSAVEDSHKTLQNDWETYKQLRQNAEDRKYQQLSPRQQDIRDVNKKKELTRNPSSEYDMESTGVDIPEGEPQLSEPETQAIDAEDIDLEGQIPAPVIETPKTSAEVRPSTKRESDNTGFADVLTGAAPALLGLLSGNARRANIGFNQGNTYLKGLNKQDIEESKNMVKTRGDLGEPVFTKRKDAAGMEAYQVPAKASATKAGKSGELKQFQMATNPSKTMYMRMNEKGQPLTPGTDTPATEGLWEPTAPVQLETSLDKYGREVKTPVATRTGQQVGQQVQTKEGEGAEVQIGKEKIKIPDMKVKEARDLIKTSIPRIDEYQKAVTEIATARNQISDKNSAPQVQKLAIGKVMKSVENRMTDADRAEYKNEYPALLNIKQKIDMLQTNEIPEPLRLAFVKASGDILQGLKYSADRYSNSIEKGFSGGNPAYSKYIRGFMTGTASGSPYIKSAPQQNFNRPEEFSKQTGLLGKSIIEKQKRIDDEIKRRGLNK